MNTLYDIRAHVENQMTRFDASCYAGDWDDVLDGIAVKFARFLKGEGFKYGDSLPEYDWEDFIELTKEFEL